MSYNIIKEKNKIYYAFLLLIILSTFFDLIILPKRTFKLIGLIILLYFYITSKQDDNKYKFWIGLIWLAVIGSVIYSFLVNHQDFFDVAFASYFAMGLGSFCVFHGLGLNYKSSLKLLKSFSIFFCSCYVIQILVYPITIFAGSLDEFSISDSHFRMRMACSACSYCLFFLGINEYMNTHKIREFLYSLLGFVPLMTMGFRSLVSLTILFWGYLIWEYNKNRPSNLLKYIVAFSVISITALQMPLVQNKIDEMLQRQNSDQTFDNKDYVRYASLAYYMNVFDTPSERIFGGGYPMTTSENPNWSCDYLREVNIGYQMKLFWNDLGMIGFAFIFGFPSAFLVSFLILRAVIKSKEKKLLFIRSTLLTIYLGSIMTSQEVYRSGNFIIIGLLFYVEYRYHLENNENRNTYVSSRG